MGIVSGYSPCFVSGAITRPQQPVVSNHQPGARYQPRILLRFHGKAHASHRRRPHRKPIIIISGGMAPLADGRASPATSRILLHVRGDAHGVYPIQNQYSLYLLLRACPRQPIGGREKQHSGSFCTRVERTMDAIPVEAHHKSRFLFIAVWPPTVERWPSQAKSCIFVHMQ